MIIDGVELEAMTLDDVEVQTWYHDGVEVYSAGKLVTYNVDSDVSHSEKVKKGLDCLSPTTFTPEKDGWTFVGWREDTTASSEVLESKVVESEAITLYAVFKKIATVSYNANSGSSAPSSQSATIYYNNGTYNYPTITLASAISRSCYTFNKWCAGSTSGTGYSAGASYSVTGDVTMYATWTFAITSGYSAVAYSPGGTFNNQATFTTEKSDAHDLIYCSSGRVYVRRALSSVTVTISDVYYWATGVPEGSSNNTGYIKLRKNGTVISTGEEKSYPNFTTATSVVVNERVPAAWTGSVKAGDYFDLIYDKSNGYDSTLRANMTIKVNTV